MQTPYAVSRKSLMLANNTVEILVNNIVSLGMFSCLIYILIDIRHTPAAHFHGKFLRHIQHNSCAYENVSTFMKSDIFNIVTTHQLLETLANIRKNFKFNRIFFKYRIILCKQICYRINNACSTPAIDKPSKGLPLSPPVHGSLSNCTGDILKKWTKK